MSAEAPRRWGWPLPKVSGTAALCVVLWARFQGSDAFEQVLNVRLELVAAALAIYAAAQLVSSVRWGILLTRCSVRVPLWTLYGHYLVGMFFNHFLPTSLGGDAVKAARLHAATGEGDAAVSTILLERLLGLIAMLVLGLAGLAMVGLKTFPPSVLATAASVSGVVLVLGVVALSERGRRAIDRASSWVPGPAVGRATRKVTESLATFSWGDPALTRGLMLSFLVQGLNVAVYAVLARALALDLNLAFLMACYPLAGLVTLLPIALGGLGVRESALALLFESGGLPSHHGVSLGLLWFAVVLLCSLAGGVVHVADVVSRARDQPLSSAETSSNVVVHGGPSANSSRGSAPSQTMDDDRVP